MTTLKDLDRIVPGVIGGLQEISNKMGRAIKCGALIADTDLRARALMSEIGKKIEQINRAWEVYKRPDLRAAYETYDFDAFVANIRAYIQECEAVYQRIIDSEHITGYF